MRNWHVEMRSFPRLFSPLTIRSVRLRNRIVSTAHGVRLAQNHLPSDADVAYYREKARGGIGLVIQEAIRVHPTTVPSPGAIIGYDERVIPALQRIAVAVHRFDTPIFGQIVHQGRQSASGFNRLPIWAPSAVPGYYNHETPHAMDEDEIREVVEGHGRAARTILAAGYDGIEIHAGHGYLLQEFMSPISNRRTDRYGGSLENRIRVVREVVDLVREVAGEAVGGIRVSGDEFTPGGLGASDMREIVGVLATEGKLDYISVSQSNYEGASISTMVPDMYVAPGAFAYLAGEIKQVVPHLPVLAVGRINTPALAERILTEGGVDLVGMTRANIADQQLPEKAERGEVERIRPCVALNVCWRTSVANGLPITCAVNPTAGREEIWGEGTLPRAGEPRRVVVAGGGPAGLEAARVLAAAGHEVVLLERSGRLGGQMALAAVAPGRADLQAWVDWAERELHQLGVRIVLDTEATPDLVREMEPAAVVVATGSHGTTWSVQERGPGRMVFNTREVLGQDLRLVGRVLVVDREYEWEAPSVAEWLAERGAQVDILTEKIHLGLLIPPVSLPTMFARLEERGIPVRSQARVIAAGGGSVIVQHPFTGRLWPIEDVDAVVVAGDRVVDDELYRALKGEYEMIIAVGDCVAPRQIMQAVYEGHAAARTIAARLARVPATR